MKQQKPHIRLLELLGCAAGFYFVGNLILNYLIAFIKYMKVMNTDNNASEIIKFRIGFILKPIETLPVQLMIMLSLCFGFFCLYKLDIEWKVHNANKDLKADDRFMTASEIANDKELYGFSVNRMHTAEKSGLPIALIGGKLYVCFSTVHSLIIGTTRSGKGQTFVLPMIYQIATSQSKHSFVANDPKGEILENTYTTLVENGYEVLVLNLRDTEQSSLWDPLAIIKMAYVKAMRGDKNLSKTIKLVQSTASVFTDNPKSDPIWPDSARSLLVAMILLLLEKGYEEDNLDKVNMYSVYNFFIEFGTRDEVKIVNGAKKNVNALDEIFQKLPVGNPAKSAYATSNFARGEMRSSIFSTLASNINIFGTDTGVSRLTSGNQIDFNKLINPKVPCAVFMVVPDEDTSRHVIASLFVNQCYNYLVELSSSYPMQKLPQRVHFILDEFGNMVRIPAMDTKITVGAGRNLLFELFVQDLNQLDTKYDNAAKTIRSNCGNVVYINSLDKDTNEYISSILGSETIEYETYSGQLHEWLKNRSINIDTKPIMSATQLSRLQFGEAVIKRQRSQPIRTKFEPFYKLNIPVTPINEIPIDLILRPLEDTLYPFKSLWDIIYPPKKTASTNNSTASADQAAEKPDTSLDKTVTSAARPNTHIPPREETAEEKAINKLNKVTQGQFVQAFGAYDFEFCDELITRAYKLRQISSDDKETLVAMLSQHHNV